MPYDKYGKMDYKDGEYDKSKGMKYPKKSMKKRRKPGTSHGSMPSPVQQATMSLLANKKKSKGNSDMDYR